MFFDYILMVSLEFAFSPRTLWWEAMALKGSKQFKFQGSNCNVMRVLNCCFVVTLLWQNSEDEITSVVFHNILRVSFDFALSACSLSCQRQWRWKAANNFTRQIWQKCNLIRLIIEPFAVFGVAIFCNQRVAVTTVCGARGPQTWQIPIHLEGSSHPRERRAITS